MISIVQQLSIAAGRTSYAKAPPIVQDRLRFAIADSLAVLLSGSTRHDVKGVRTRFVNGDGPATLIGFARGSNAATASLVNGIPIAAEQLQDGHRLARGHPMAHLLPAVFAVAESENSSSYDFLSALLAGYELGVRLGIAMDGTPPGVHDIGTWASIGSTAAVAHLLSNGSAEVITAAIELAAASLLAFDAATVFDGASGQHLFLGLACQSSVINGYGADSGLSAPNGTLERFYLPRNSRNFKPETLDEDLTSLGEWKRYLITSGYHKVHPTCAHLHGVNDAVENIIFAGDVDPSEIDSVIVETYKAAAEFSSQSPINDLAARFSIPYTVAVALIRGGLDQEAFEEQWLSDGKVRDLASRVTVMNDPSLDNEYPGGRPARVTVVSRNGDTKVSLVKAVRGDGCSALQDRKVVEKPLVLMSKVVGGSLAKQLIDAIFSLPSARIGSLTKLLREIKI